MNGGRAVCRSYGTCSARRTHIQSYPRSCKTSKAADVLKGAGILKAARQDIEAGFLKTLESLVSADIFTEARS
jgi:hypothetical protein